MSEEKIVSRSSKNKMKEGRRDRRTLTVVNGILPDLQTQFQTELIKQRSHVIRDALDPSRRL